MGSSQVLKRKKKKMHCNLLIRNIANHINYIWGVFCAMFEINLQETIISVKLSVIQGQIYKFQVPCRKAQGPFKMQTSMHMSCQFAYLTVTVGSPCTMIFCGWQIRPFCHIKTFLAFELDLDSYCEKLAGMGKNLLDNTGYICTTRILCRTAKTM